MVTEIAPLGVPATDRAAAAGAMGVRGAGAGTAVSVGDGGYFDDGGVPFH